MDLNVKCKYCASKIERTAVICKTCNRHQNSSIFYIGILASNAAALSILGAVVAFIYTWAIPEVRERTRAQIEIAFLDFRLVGETKLSVINRVEKPAIFGNLETEVQIDEIPFAWVKRSIFKEVTGGAVNEFQFDGEASTFYHPILKNFRLSSQIVCMRLQSRLRDRIWRMI